MSTAKCRGALAPVLQAAPSLLALVDWQIVGRQRVSPAAMAWNFLPPDFAAIDIGKGDDRRTINREHAFDIYNASATLIKDTAANAFFDGVGVYRNGRVTIVGGTYENNGFCGVLPDPQLAHSRAQTPSAGQGLTRVDCC